MSMSNETWFYRDFPLVVGCPECGGRVWLGTEMDWPAELGGDPIQQLCKCESCYKEWRWEDYEYPDQELPEAFLTPSGEYFNVAIPTTEPLL